MRTPAWVLALLCVAAVFAQQSPVASPPNGDLPTPSSECQRQYIAATSPDDARLVKERIDSTTPEDACTLQLCTNSSFATCQGNNPLRKTMQLVFSEEFTEDGLAFGAAARNPRWTAESMWYSGTQDIENYQPEQVKTRGGFAVIEMEAKTSWALSQQPDGSVWNVTKNYTSGFLSSWNKFCFTGGYLEASVQLPGDDYISGLWPAFWLLGNLGRPGYQASIGGKSPQTDNGIFPYSYNYCGGGNSGVERAGAISPQNRSACTDPPGFDRTLYGMKPGVGRGAPEIDIMEVKVPPSTDEQTGQPIPRGLPRGGLPGQHPNTFTSMTLQVAPLLPNGTTWQDPYNNSTQGPLGPGIFLTKGSGDMYTHATCWEGDFATGMLPQLQQAQKQQGFDNAELQQRLLTIRPGNLVQDSLAAMATLTSSYFSTFHTFGVHWQPQEFVRWYIDGQLIYEVNKEARRAQANSSGYATGPWLIPVEAMAINLNLGMSDAFVPVDLDRLTFPADFKVDYVRLYQAPDAINLGCSPPEYPTAQYIACKRDTYVIKEEDQVLVPNACNKLPSCRAQAASEIVGGKSLGQVSNTTVQECCSTCGRTPGCKAYTFNPYLNNVCDLKVGCCLLGAFTHVPQSGSPCSDAAHAGRPHRQHTQAPLHLSDTQVSQPSRARRAGSKWRAAGACMRASCQGCSSRQGPPSTCRLLRLAGPRRQLVPGPRHLPPPRPPPPPGDTNDTSDPASASSSAPVGAIVGGVLGGLAVAAALAVLALRPRKGWLRRGRAAVDSSGQVAAPAKQAPDPGAAVTVDTLLPAGEGEMLKRGSPGQPPLVPLADPGCPLRHLLTTLARALECCP
ncbi:hypothetical protein ABPG75_005304 [Micractinium tetrahymenae]